MGWDDWARVRGLPRREADTMLAIPECRQQSPTDCGPAVVSAVLRFWGIDVEPPGAHPYLGLHPDTMETALRLAGLNVLAGEMDVADLRYHVGRGRPVIVLIQSGGVGHYVICKSVTGRGAVAVMDPDGGPPRYGKREFLTIWKDADRHGTPYHRYGLAVWRG